MDKARGLDWPRTEPVQICKYPKEYAKKHPGGLLD